MIRSLSAYSLLVFLSLGCSSLDRLSEDGTKLSQDLSAKLSRRLVLEISGGSPAQRKGLSAALRSKLEDGDLFNTVVTLEKGKEAGAASRLRVNIRSRQAQHFGAWIHDKQGWIVRYELDVKLTDAAGRAAVSGPIMGIALDDDTLERHLTQSKKEEIEEAAHASAALRLSEALRNIVSERLEDERKLVKPLEFARGVGPLKLAILNVDVKRAHPSTRPSELRSELEAAFKLAGTELKVLDQDRIERALERSDIEFTGLTLNPELATKVERNLVSRLVVLVTVRSGNQGATVEASLFELRGSARLIARVRKRGTGVGAVRLASLRVVGALIAELGRARFEPRPVKKD